MNIELDEMSLTDITDNTLEIAAGPNASQLEVALYSYSPAAPTAACY